MLVTVALLASACAETQTVAPDAGGHMVQLKLRAGDVVRVVTKYRERFAFRIVKICPQALAGVTVTADSALSSTPGFAQKATIGPGRTVTVPYGDLALIEVRRVSKARTAAIAAGAVAVVTVIGALVVGNVAYLPAMAP